MATSKVRSSLLPVLMMALGGLRCFSFDSGFVDGRVWQQTGRLSHVRLHAKRPVDASIVAKREEASRIREEALKKAEAARAAKLAEKGGAPVATPAAAKATAASRPAETEEVVAKTETKKAGKAAKATEPEPEPEAEEEAVAAEEEEGEAAPLVVGCWNQHRKSSYVQKDAPWTAALIELGYKQSTDIVPALEEAIDVKYSKKELRNWLAEHDILAIQEADPIFCATFPEEVQEEFILGSNDKDARGVEVESSCGLIIRPDSGLSVVKKATAALTVQTRPGKEAQREHTAVLVKRESDGAQLAICSVHLHSAELVESSQTTYLKYLRPLKEAIETVTGTKKDGKVKIPVLFIGDFNIEPEDFTSKTETDKFWAQFTPQVPEGGDTAHSSGITPRGDFALASGDAEWTGSASGPEDFSEFESYAKKITTALKAHLKSAPKRTELLELIGAAEEAVTAAESAIKADKKAASHLVEAKAKLRELAGSVAPPPKKFTRTMANSDHRPLRYEGIFR